MRWDARDAALVGSIGQKIDVPMSPYVLPS
jgi:hypothetical protein